MRRGRSWGEPDTGRADLEVEGGDADLAAVALTHPGARIRYRPSGSADLARALGLRRGDPVTDGTRALPIDAVSVDGLLALNAVVLGTAPGRLRWGSATRPTRVMVDGRLVFDGRATTVVVASGQFIDGLDVVPRGHPGDGRLEIQVYAISPRERARLRDRLATGSHLPHPRIVTATGRRVEIRSRRRWPTRLDGVARGIRRDVTLEVVPAALRLLV